MMATIPDLDEATIERLVDHAERTENWIKIGEKKRVALKDNPNYAVSHHGTEIIFSVNYSTDTPRKTGPMPFRHLSVRRTDDKIQLKTIKEFAYRLAQSFGFSDGYEVYSPKSKKKKNAGIYHIVENLFLLD